MMGWYGGSMMAGGFGLIASAFWIIIFIDLILLAIWLWKQINKK